MILIPQYRTARRAGAAAFSMLDLSPVLWLDASDSATLFDADTGGSLPTDGNDVLRWEDKSGNAYHYTNASGATAPLRQTAAVNGLDALEFMGAEFLLRETDTPLHRNVSGATQIVICQSDITTTSTAYTVSRGNNATFVRTNVASSAITTNRISLSGRRLDADAGINVTSSTNHGTGAICLIGVFDYGNNDLILYQNGSNVGQNLSFNSAGSTSDTNSLRSRIGADLAGTSSFWNGFICEIAVIHSVLDAGQIADVTAYAQSKWGTP